MLLFVALLSQAGRLSPGSARAGRTPLVEHKTAPIEQLTSLSLAQLKKLIEETRSENAEIQAEIEVVETFLRRRWDLPDVPRQWMAWRVSLPIMYKIRPTYDLATFTYEGFLEELLHRYRREHRFTG